MGRDCVWCPKIAAGKVVRMMNTLLTHFANQAHPMNMTTNPNDTEAVLAMHCELCQTVNVDCALENGASLTDGDVEARTWAALYLDDKGNCHCEGN